jgi:quinol monooxygenase YgiN
MTYGLFGKFTAQADKRDELVDYLLQAAELLQRNPGCIHYVVSTSQEPEAVWVSEVWTDPERTTPPSSRRTSARSSSRPGR